MTYSIFIQADVARQSEIADWCSIKLVNKWGMLPELTSGPDNLTKVCTWLWTFESHDDFLKFTAEWPWTHQTSVHCRWTESEIVAMAKWCKKNLESPAELMMIDNRHRARPTFPSPGDFWAILHARFTNERDQFYWKMVWE